MTRPVAGNDAQTEGQFVLRLAGGRRLAYTVTGPADGAPVLYCHGAIGTPIEATVDLEQLVGRLHVRYIAPSRPGIGGSDPQPGRTVRDFASDVEQLADALGLERFDVAGVSAGGPYALAVAHELRDRVGRIALCSSLSPLWPLHRTPGLALRIRLALGVFAGAPRLTAAAGDAVLPIIARNPGLLNRVISAHAAPQERERLATAAERSAAATSFLDAAAGGVGGLVEDFRVYSQPWGFAAAQVGAEVHLWHGAADPLVPVEHALQLAVSLPRCRIFLDPDEGHHFFRSTLGLILAVLLDRDADLGRDVETTIEGARATLSASRAAGSSMRRRQRVAKRRRQAAERRDQAAARSSASGGRTRS